jgi:hypothetical protein
VQNQMEMVSKHINFLKSLDTEEYYEKNEDDVIQYAQPTVQNLVSLGSTATSSLLNLLKTEFTWSCYFALVVLRQTKDPQAVPYLIDFLKKESDDSMADEEAMFALQDIGDPCINPLIDELKNQFYNKTYNTYLVGSLTGIIGPEPYDFMVKTTQDFISRPWHYKGWFLIDDFTYNFVEQERTDVLPLLKQVADMRILTLSEKQEIQETIQALENPAEYQQKIEDTINDISETTEDKDT